MKFAFRVDASLAIGSGHVMRCLTLAQALRARGHACHFICRAHQGHLAGLLRDHGMPVSVLPAAPAAQEAALAAGPAHAPWLGCGWEDDARASAALLASLQPDWLVVDHYALDQRWEAAVRAAHGAMKLLVIDDLADRAHACDVLLDQNLGRGAHDYQGLVPAACVLLAGPRYALLRPEFAAVRGASLARNRDEPARILVSMGGVDQPNATGLVLETLKRCALPEHCRISVIMGASAPWIAQVRAVAAGMPWPVDVLVNVSDMARRMADSDLAIGAAGSTAWERCCLGLPAVMVVLAENQANGAAALHEAGAAISIGTVDAIPAALPPLLDSLRGERLAAMSRRAAGLADGAGVAALVQVLEAQ